jgi:adhesin HecA-like repeat protein
MHDGSVFMRADGLGPWMDMFCSQVCQDGWEKRGREAGNIISLSDLTLERANELLNTAGLAIAGVGKVNAS